MQVNIRFNTNDDIELIDDKKFPFGTNFINFLSSNIENILNDNIISNLSKNNYKEIISKINKATNDVIIPEIIDINVSTATANTTVNIKQIKNDLTQILDTYTKFKELTEFCYFNDNLKNMTRLQSYIYYLHISKIEEVTLPKQTISSFGLNSKKKYSNENILVMLKKKSPYLYYNYQCSSINDYCTASFLQLIENNYIILKCKNCNKYFIPYKRTDTYYCDRQAPQDTTKTCKKYAIELAWNEKIKDENDWHCLYRRVYQSLQLKAKRNLNNLQLQHNFDNFKTNSKEWKKAIKEGKKTDEEFLQWLQDFRK